MLEMRALSVEGSRFWSPGIGRGVGVVKSTKPHLVPTLGAWTMDQEKSTPPLGLTLSLEDWKFWIQVLLALDPSGIEQVPLIITPCAV